MREDLLQCLEHSRCSVTGGRVERGWAQAACVLGPALPLRSGALLNLPSAAALLPSVGWGIIIMLILRGCHEDSMH